MRTLARIKNKAGSLLQIQAKKPDAPPAPKAIMSDGRTRALQTQSDLHCLAWARA